MDDETRAFVTTFRAFLEDVVHRQGGDGENGQPLLPVLRDHLGVEPQSLPVVTEIVAPHRLADLDVALEILGGAQRTVIGIGGGDERRHSSFGEIVNHARRHRMFNLGPVDYARVPTGPDSSRQIVGLGIVLTHHDGVPVAALQRTADPQYGRDQASLSVLAPDEATSSAFLESVRAAMNTHSVLRGQVFSFTSSDYRASSGGITFHRRAELARDDVILPDGTLDRIERHVVGIARHREVLRDSGQHLKRGVLLFGPPGTGKTHTIRYLTCLAADSTVILMSGSSLRLVSIAADTARALQPAIVVLEDCDLIAEDRSLSHGPQPLLYEVLDVLDGLAADADVAFLLSTNRADLLEPALAQRPGRVDLAAEIPRPDLDARKQLNRLYATGLPFSAAALDEAAARSEGTTASFAKELMRRAVLVAAERGEEPADEHLSGALRELLSDADELTRALLGGSEGGGGPVPPRPPSAGGPSPGPVPGVAVARTGRR